MLTPFHYRYGIPNFLPARFDATSIFPLSHTTITPPSSASRNQKEYESILVVSIDHGRQRGILATMWDGVGAAVAKCE